MDSTGIEGEWKCKKHGPERHRQWRKLHIGIDAQTLQIRAICVTSNEVADATVIADLLEQVPRNEAVLSLTGDGAYDTQSVYEETIQRWCHSHHSPAKERTNTQRHRLCVPQFGYRRIASVWAEGYGKFGVVITDAVWSKPR